MVGTNARKEEDDQAVVVFAMASMLTGSWTMYRNAINTFGSTAFNTNSYNPFDVEKSLDDFEVADLAFYMILAETSSRITLIAIKYIKYTSSQFFMNDTDLRTLRKEYSVSFFELFDMHDAGPNRPSSRMACWNMSESWPVRPAEQVIT